MRYSLVELLTASLFAAVFAHDGLRPVLVIARILRHLGETVEPPPVAPAREVRPRLIATVGNRVILGLPFQVVKGEFRKTMAER